MRPIETFYNGYRFRSRLEARWAVFFDSAGLAYEYEPEGFDLDGKWYLPDFYLRQFDIYIEIKPRSLSEEAKNNAETLCEKFRTKTGYSILLCYGDPAEGIYHKFYGWGCKENGGWVCDSNALFYADIIGTLKLHVFALHTICTRDCMSSNEYVSNVFDGSEVKHQNLPLHWGIGNAMFDIYRSSARQARFEHGEHGGSV